MRSRAELEAKALLVPDPGYDPDPIVATLYPGADILTLLIRMYYGGRKGRAARKRLRNGVPCALIFDDGVIVESVYRIA